MPADVFALTKRAFAEMLKIRGVSAPIVFNGKKRKCIPGAIWRNNQLEIVASLGKSRTTVDMLAEDFDALGDIVSSQSVVLLDDLIMAVHAITRDASDPCVHFIAIGDHAASQAPGAVVVNFDEGSVPLAIDQVEVSLVFHHVNPNSPHVFTHLYVENLVDPNPIGTFDPVPSVLTANGRTIMLAAAPDTANYILRWRVQS